MSMSMPQVWVGCVGCYAAGGLVGQWIDADLADTVTVTDLHRALPSPAPHGTFHEELWCYDSELPGGERSPESAAEYGLRLAEIDEALRPAFLAWIRTGAHVVDADDLPIASAFEDSYCGEWESFQAFADEQIDALGVLRDAPDEIARYFDFASYARDLSYDYTVVDAESGIFVFRDL